MSDNTTATGQTELWHLPREGETGAGTQAHDTGAATAPLLSHQEDIDAATKKAVKFALKRVFQQLAWGFVLLLPEVIAVTLAAFAVREVQSVKSLPEGVHIALYATFSYRFVVSLQPGSQLANKDIQGSLPWSLSSPR